LDKNLKQENMIVAKKVFVVVGSNDGNLGVYTNVKRAYERVQEYFSSCDETPSMSYAQVCKAVQGWGCIIGDGYVSATIQVFYLND